jgi:hypothetical protein
MIERMDSRHWSQRWMRLAQVGSDAVVLYDLHQPVEIKGCGRGRCDNLHGAAMTGTRFRVTRFWQMEICPSCGRPFGYARADETVYFGNSLNDAIAAFEKGELALIAEDGRLPD